MGFVLREFMLSEFVLIECDKSWGQDKMNGGEIKASK